MITTKLPSCWVATSTLRMAMPGTNRMLPCLSWDRVLSDGLKTKVVLSLLMLRIESRKTRCSTFTTLSVNVA